MFSPTHTPPPESSSEGEDDLPIVDIGTPRKLPKLGNEPTLPTKCTDPAASSKPAHVSSPSSSTLLPAHFQGNVKPAAHSDSHREKFKSTIVAARSQNTFQSITDDLKDLSPLKVERHRGANESRKTANKVKKLSKSLKEKAEMERKLEELRSLNGIQGIVKSEEKKSALSTSQQEPPAQKSNGSSFSEFTQLCSHSSIPVDDFFCHSSSAGDNLLSSSLSTNPGKAIFVRKPSLITELYPPGIDVQDGGLLGDVLTHGSVEDLKKVVCGQMLPLAYIAMPCPIELSQWLFQLMACSSDPEISSGAFRSLVGLLKYARKQEKNSFSTPSVAEITDVLVTLGAEREKLRPLIFGGTQVQVMPMDEEREEVFSPACPPSINLLNTTSYISACIRTLPCNYSVQHLEDLVLILSSLSLDHYCLYFLKMNLHTCIHHILAAYPEKAWLKAVKRLSPQLCCLSQHHRDKVFLAGLINGNMPRARYLVRDFCRRCLVQMIDTEACSSEEKYDKDPIHDSVSLSKDDNCDCAASQGDQVSTSTLPSEHLGVSDCSFLKQVLKSYCRVVHREMTDMDYCKMSSLLQILQFYAPLCDLTFPSEDVKQEFISLLGTLRTNVREDLMRPITSIVKDMLIHMKLVLDTRSSSRKDKQTDLFSFSS